MERGFGAGSTFCLPNNSVQHSGPLMGGDPVRNEGFNCWGTICFAAPVNSNIEIETETCDNRCVSCSHVLFHASNTQISTPNSPNSMTRDWHKEPSGSFTTDVAAGVIKANTDVKHLEVRGLGQIKGARQPSNGIRVSKYGAATGLTSGKD